MEIRHNEEHNKQLLIDKLRSIIILESSKPVSEIDSDLIDECVDFLMELEGHSELTEKQFEEAKRKFLSSSRAEFKKADNKTKRVRFKGLLIAACLALMLLIANFTAIACGVDTMAVLKEFGNRIAEMVTGDKEEFEGITIYKLGEYKNYDSIESFFKEEKINALYPAKLPDGVRLTMIDISGYLSNDGILDKNYNNVFYVTDSPHVRVSFITSPDADKSFLTLESYSKEVVNNIDCYIYIAPEFVQCNFIHNGFVYTVTAPSKGDIITIVENLKEIK